MSCPSGLLDLYFCCFPHPARMLLSYVPSRSSERFGTAISVASALLVISCLMFTLYYNDLFTSPTTNTAFNKPEPAVEHTTLVNIDSIDAAAEYFLDYPLQPPYKNIFGELGERTQLLQTWIQHLQDDDIPTHDRLRLRGIIEKVSFSFFPYLKPAPGAPHNATLFSDLLSRFDGSRHQDGGSGIVIPTGQHTLRYSCHLLASLTRVHKTHLPVEIVYAGDSDLTPEGREALKQAGEGLDISFIDALTVFDDSTLRLAQGGWAIKAFAALASRFDDVILLDADAVFVQPPERLLEQARYLETGALLFHDRLLWKGGFMERQDWWHEQLKHPGPERNKSLVWTEQYSEEGDSGVVVVNKSRLDILMGLFHIGWQNTYPVRDEWTYKITYGDKETWWIGLEAVGASYAFSRHYGGMVGWLRLPTETPEDEAEGEKEKEKPKEQRVCSFVIAHVDEDDRLLWYNGGLLKNKLANQRDFDVPSHWMIDQRWEKGAKKDMSCMVGNDVNKLSGHERDILSKSIDAAKDVDKKLDLIPLDTV